jgi:hypothetical protein
MKNSLVWSFGYNLFSHELEVCGMNEERSGVEMKRNEEEEKGKIEGEK